MKSLYDTAETEKLFQRLARLTPETKPGWGKLSPEAMVCHLSDGIVFALEGPPKAVIPKSPPMFVRHMIRLYLPWPKGVPAPSEMFVSEVTDLETAKLKLRAIVTRFQKVSQIEFAMHPFFGKLDGKAWAKVGWRHFNHHLVQFGL